jgi:hypothetical protein
VAAEASCGPIMGTGYPATALNALAVAGCGSTDKGMKFMQKITSLFQRNYDGDRLVRNEIVPGAEWVVNGEGVATRKFDGTCCLVRDGKLYKRYDAKGGKTPPVGFEPAQSAPDPVTGHWPGWVLAYDGDPWHIEAWTNKRWEHGMRCHGPVNGTYELCGPKINGNPEAFECHILVFHGHPKFRLEGVPTEFHALRTWLAPMPIEGIVWHHPDGRMAKIKKKDFGLKR